MQLVSDLQQRPRKGRLKMEKLIIPFNDLCFMVQLIVFIIQTVQIYIGASRTFMHNFFINSDFELAPSIVYKTVNCNFSTVRNIYAFNNVSMNFTPASINDVFVDNAIQLRLSIFIMAVALFLGGFNRMSVEVNFFSFRWRNFILYKDLFSACELILLGYVFQIAAATEPPGKLLRDYLSHCNVVSTNYLPFVRVVTLYVFAGVGYGTYAVGIVLYLWNTLPKYGVMTDEEIVEYKEWLRAKRLEVEQSRAFIEQAKQAHARVQMMQSAEYNVAQVRNEREKGRGTPMPLPVPPPAYGQTNAMYGPAPLPDRGWSGPRPEMAYPTPTGPTLPPPQLFGMPPGGGGGGPPNTLTRRRV